MAGVNREIRFNIKADTSQAEVELKHLQSDIESIRAPALTFGDVRQAQEINSTARQTVGVLGDFDTALQTIGSVTGTTSLQIVGDFFAVGEAAGQLRGAFPELKARFGEMVTSIGSMGFALGAAVVALGAVTLAFSEMTSAVDSQRAAIKADVEGRLQAEKDIATLSSEALAERVKNAQIEAEFAQKQADEMRRLNEELWNGLVEELGDAGARIALATYGGLYSDEEIAQIEAAARKNEEYVAAVQAATPAIDTLNESIREVGNSEPIQRQYAESVKYVALNTEIAARKAEEYAQRLEGVASGMALTAKTIKDGRIVDIEEEKQAQQELFQQAEQDREKALQEQQRLLEQQERERQRMLEQQARDYERQLGQIEDFERRQADIRNRWREQALQAELNNDVEAFLNARRERKEARRDLASQVNSTFNINVGELVTPQELQNLEQTIVNALTFVNSQKAGTF